MNTDVLTLLADGAVERKSQEVTHWAERIGWVVGMILVIALVYWLMRQGWKWRATLQGDLPEPAPVPATADTPELTLTGRYHGSTAAGQWLERIVAHGLGTRSRVELSLTARGLTVLRPGARDFAIPREALRGARLDKGIAGKVVTEGGMLVITWQLGDRTLDSGFRADHPAEHPRWVTAVTQAAAAGPAAAHTTAHTGDSAVAGRHDREGAA
ncbi:hypothetical protein V1J52_12805 [Streptomyces sp. TRM 70351]|uniref:PH-like domain-containing protein n=1 Tax=Streptomyces sp. TRM 70351 TaxID=3116552 RepID=UPI002E7B6A9C|nr:hypothetical protein [Streptomyces sp. TRM 70351]MEE1929048.1 hypothetical protein [Streptomyces sp. TRM 70351]